MSTVSGSSTPQNTAPDLPAGGSPKRSALDSILDKIWSVPTRLNMGRTVPILFLTVTGILYFRLHGVFRNPNLFAEDGNIFFKQQYDQGFFSALFTIYAGYLHFVPRIVAGLCSLLPLEWTPAAYMIISLLIAAAVMTFFIAPGFRAVIDSDSIRAVIVVIFTILPNDESLMKLAYVNWFVLVFIAFITLFTLPKNKIALWLFFFPAALSTWSTPIAICCLPVILFRAWKAENRTERIWWLCLALVMTGYPLSAEQPPPVIGSIIHGSDGKLALLHALGYRVFCFFFFGGIASYFLAGPGWAAITGVSLILIAITVYATLRTFVRSETSGYSRYVPLILFYLIISSSAMYILRPLAWHFFLQWTPQSWEGNGRYFYCSVLLLCILGGVCYERVLRDWITANPRRRRMVFLLLVCWLNLQELDFKMWVWPSGGRWSNYCQKIHAAEARVLKTGITEKVHVSSGLPNFDFDVVVTPAAARRNHS